MTNAPLEMYADPVWEILDPNSAQVVAVFHDEAAAREYLEWRNSRRAAGGMTPCDRCGGAWGEDQTCARCTDETGNACAKDKPGPLGPGAVCCRRPCEGCNAEYGEPCRWGCLSSVPLDCLIEAIEMWVDRPKKKRELIETGDYLAKVASDYLRSTGATPVAPVIPDREDNQ